MQGLVLKSTGKIYNIILENGEIVKATIRGKLRIEGLKTTNPIAAGDRVKLTAASDTNSQDLLYHIQFNPFFLARITLYGNRQI
jgi:Translation initiation factor 1 (IF-1)